MLVTGLLIGAAAGATGAPAATTDADRIERGFKIAPVRLNLKGLSRDLVGLGSYIVNSQGGCNDCHTNPPFAPGGNPFMGQPKRINEPVTWPAARPSALASSRPTSPPTRRAAPPA